VPTKTEAGRRSIPMLPALRRALLTWKIKSPYTAPEDYIACAVGGVPVMERNLRRALDAAKAAAGLDGTEERLSWHSLRHSYASLLATDLAGAAPTLARIVGHADAGFTLKVYAKDARDESAVVTDVLARAATAQIGG
jgi:integrase